MARFLSLFKKIDWFLLVVVFLLVVFSLVTIYSIGKNSDPPNSANFIKQLISAIIGFVLMIFFSFVSFRFWKSYSFLFYILGFVLLVVVLIFGSEIGGTKGWINIFGYTFQPVELVRLCLILFLAQFFSKRELAMDSFKNIVISASAVVLFVLLVLLQPDLGSAILMLIVWLASIFLLKTKKKHLLMIVVVLVVLAAASWFLLLKDYQKDRIMTFLNPTSDPLGAGYNITQSMIAIGSGNFFGRGLGLGPQSQLNFLPTQETDFIFSVIAEELGFVGAFIILILFALLFFRLYKILKSQKDSFAVLFIFQAMVLIFAQVVINIGMNVGVLPITGLPLPFVSLAGTSLMVNLIIIGIIQSMFVRKSA